MTIQSTRGTEPDIDQLITNAYHQAGLVNFAQSPSNAMKAAGRQMLDRIVDGLTTRGVMARNVVFSVHDLTGSTTAASSTYIYAMPSDVLDIIGDIMYIPASAGSVDVADEETVVRKISRSKWQTLSAKASVGRPTLYYVHRGVDPIEVWLWPKPDESGRIRVQEHRLPADTTEGNATLDLLSYWYDYITWEMAHRLALGSSLSSSRVKYLGDQARDALRYARGYARDAGNDAVYRHPTAWSSTRR